MITQENFDANYVDTIEQQEIDKFVCHEMSRQMHRYIKAMKGTHRHMLRFEERLQSMTIPERERAIAHYIDLNRHSIDGLDFKIVLTRAMANYCDTFEYLLKMVNDRRKMVDYLHRIRSKYIRYHEVFEENGKFGIRDSEGTVIVPAEYDFLRTCYVYVDDLLTMPIIAQRDGKLGLVLPDGKNTVVAPFIYDDISLREEPPFFETMRNGKEGRLNADGTAQLDEDWLATALPHFTITPR